MPTKAESAWNNFVLNSQWQLHERGSRTMGSIPRQTFVGGTNSGGLNSFLMSTWDIPANDIVVALQQIGASKAAGQLQWILPPTSQDDRWGVLKQGWTDALNVFGALGRKQKRNFWQRRRPVLPGTWTSTWRSGPGSKQKGRSRTAPF